MFRTYYIIIPVGAPFCVSERGGFVNGGDIKFVGY